MTIQIASEFLSKLRLLTLAGQDEEGDLQWIGKTENWDKLHLENESILRDHEIKNEMSYDDDDSGDRVTKDHFNSSNDLPDWAGGMDL